MLKKVVALTLVTLIAASVLSVAGVGSQVRVARAALVNPVHTHTLVSHELRVLISTTHNKNIVERWYDVYHYVHCSTCAYVQKKVRTGRIVVRSLH
jgi:hypothetical protein